MSKAKPTTYTSSDEDDDSFFEDLKKNAAKKVEPEAKEKVKTPAKPIDPQESEKPKNKKPAKKTALKSVLDSKVAEITGEKKEEEVVMKNTSNKKVQKAKKAKDAAPRGRRSIIPDDQKLVAGSAECRESGHYGQIKEVFSKPKTVANGVKDLLAVIDPPRSKEFKGNEKSWIRSYIVHAVHRKFLKKA